MSELTPNDPNNLQQQAMNQAKAPAPGSKRAVNISEEQKNLSLKELNQARMEEVLARKEAALSLRDQRAARTELDRLKLEEDRDKALKRRKQELEEVEAARIKIFERMKQTWIDTGPRTTSTLVGSTTGVVAGAFVSSRLQADPIAAMANKALLGAAGSLGGHLVGSVKMFRDLNAKAGIKNKFLADQTIAVAKAQEDKEDNQEKLSKSPSAIAATQSPPDLDIGIKKYEPPKDEVQPIIGGNIAEDVSAIRHFLEDSKDPEVGLAEREREAATIREAQHNERVAALDRVADSVVATQEEKSTGWLAAAAAFFGAAGSKLLTLFTSIGGFLTKIPLVGPILKSINFGPIVGMFRSTGLVLKNLIKAFGPIGLLVSAVMTLDLKKDIVDPVMGVVNAFTDGRILDGILNLISLPSDIIGKFILRVGSEISSFFGADQLSAYLTQIADSFNLVQIFSDAGLTIQQFAKEKWQAVSDWWSGFNLVDIVTDYGNELFLTTYNKWFSLSEWWDTLDLLGPVVSFKDEIVQKATNAWTDLTSWWDSIDILGAVSGTSTALVDKTRQAWNDLTSWWDSFSMLGSVSTAKDQLTAKTSQAWTELSSWWQEFSIVESVLGIKEKISEVLSSKWNDIVSFWKDFKVTDIFSWGEKKVTELANSANTELIQPAVQKATEIKDTVVAGAETAWSEANRIADESWTAVTTAASEATANVVSAVAGAIDEFVGWFTDQDEANKKTPVIILKPDEKSVGTVIGPAAPPATAAELKLKNDSLAEMREQKEAAKLNLLHQAYINNNNNTVVNNSTGLIMSRPQVRAGDPTFARALHNSFGGGVGHLMN